MKDDPLFNSKFVKIIELHPCLYDVTSDGYSKRVVTDKAWDEVAREVNDSVQVCKERWKNLRTVFYRHLNESAPNGSGAKPKNKYYMHEAMQFMLPFIKYNKKRKRNMSTLITPRDSNGDNANEQESADTQKIATVCRILSDTENEAQDIDNKRSKPPCKQNFEERDVKDANKCHLEHIQQLNKQENADAKFLLSLLPDVTQMNLRQKRKFKRGVIDLIDFIFDEEEQRSVCDASSSGLLSPAVSINSLPSTSANLANVPSPKVLKGIYPG